MSQQHDLEGIVKQLSELSVYDLSKLKKLLEEAWGVKAEAMMAAALPHQEGSSVAAKEEEVATEFNVFLTKVPSDKKIAVIKIVRECTGLGLSEVKAFVETEYQNKPVKEKLKKEEAEEIKSKLEGSGANAEIKPT